MSAVFLDSIKKEFLRYKAYGDQTLERLTLDQMLWEPSADVNSVAVLVKHMSGNMKSRFTHFLTEDGEKSWRNRDQEFEVRFESKEEVIALWEDGWNILFHALGEVNENNFETTVYIRAEAHSITHALHRQLAHYASHTGQMMYLGKIILGEDWKSLSIPLGQSAAFNQKMFGK
jgi:hypothetical protein